MNKKSIIQIASACISVTFILIFHNAVIVSDCAKRGGTFENSIGGCLLKSGEKYIAPYNDYLIGGYFIFAIVCTYLISRFLQRIFIKAE